jgi:hypothetical protein
MCCFSVATPAGWVARLFARPVHVSRTNIFARMVSPGSQVLAYSMNLSTRLEIAMVLPLPIARGAGEDAVRFLDLSAHPTMFMDFAHLFEMMVTRAKGGPSFSRARDTLVVHDIGSFIASYVPARADFDRLDARFRMPDVLFDAVPHYADYGFAVFQLRPGTVTVHPMALAFPSREPDKLFFPTVHVHDGRFHARARFDHALYYQQPSETKVDEHIVLGEPEGEVTSWVKPKHSYGELVDVELPMLRQKRRGKHPNADIWVPAR